MTTTLSLRIERTEEAGSGAAAETAAVRLIALLPQGWEASLLEYTDTTASFSLTAPASLSAPAADRELDAVLASPALRGWTRS
ncbi:hypothetical protein [Streptomyces sp. NPDC060194]|uniref:hypothetical protein n=1 Tax=Streptomyces sp. NPDC060194 TaxID=3347069 RepID=UPI003661E07B